MEIIDLYVSNDELVFHNVTYCLEIGLNLSMKIIKLNAQ